MSQNTFSLESTSIIRDLRNHLAGRAVGISNDKALLEEILKIFFCVRLFPERYLGQQDFLTQAKVVRDDFTKIKKNNPDLYEKRDEILLDPRSINYTIEAIKALELSNAKRKIDVVSSLYQAFIGNHIRGQEGQFFTPIVAIDFLVAAVDPKPNWKIIDTACGSCSFLSAIYLHLVNNHSEEKVRKFIKSNLFGIEKDKELSKLAKIHLALLMGESPQIINDDSLLVKKDGTSEHVDDGYFDLVITNPPFGSRIRAADSETAAKYELGYKWEKTEKNYIKTNQLLANTPPQVLFTERNIKALKPGGILATVVPESLLSNKNYKSATQLLVNTCDILAIVGMPESLFKTSGKGGTHTKTSLLIAQKKLPKSSKQPNKIFMAEAKWCGHDSRGNTIPKNDIPEILNNYRSHQKNKLGKPTVLGYPLSRDTVEDLIFAPRYYDIEFSAWRKKALKENKLISLGDLVNRGIITITTGDEVGKLAYGTGEVPYIRTSDISNWETKIDNKHSVSREIYEKYKEKQDVKNGDILMVKDGTYLIGTIGLITKTDEEMIYQSHLYKIRVNENKIGLTPHNMFAILSSNFLLRQIKSKQLTQDIIDSLGRRIYDLQIPIPKKKVVLQDLDRNMRKVFVLKEKSRNHVLRITQAINSLF